MTGRARILLCLISLSIFAASSSAQEGHPLTGTWSGDWGPNATERIRVTFVMNWDGDIVAGIMNPGPDSTPIQNVYVDYATWMVRIEAASKDASGNSTTISAEGRLEDIVSRHRTITGSWRQGAVNGDFQITRD